MMMFDDYSATLPLIIVVVFETFSVSWLYGADRFVLFPLVHVSQTRSFLSALAFCRFLDDIEAMLGWRPSVIYKYLWKYICLLAMLGLLGATTIQMFIKHPTYLAWNEEEVFKRLILVQVDELCSMLPVLHILYLIISGSQLAALSCEHFLPGDGEIPRLSWLGSGSAGSAHHIRHNACPCSPGPHTSEEQNQKDIQRCRDGSVQHR